MNAIASFSTPRRRRAVWPWIVLAVLLAVLLAAIATASWVGDLETLPVHVVIDGEDVWHFDPALLGVQPWMIVAGVVVALLVAIVVVPVALAIAFVALAIGLLFGLGVPLLVGALVACVALSPLFLLIALGVWLWRKSSAPAANIAP
jgi:hypothetical protein